MDSLWRDLVAPSLAAAFGTGVGAWIAFATERRKDIDRREDERVTAANTAIYAMVKVANDLHGYRLQHLETQRNNPDRWYLVPATPLPSPSPFDTASLAYLFELEGEAPSLPLKVHLGLERYASLHELAKVRNAVHVDEAQPAIEKMRSRPDDGRTLEQQLVAATGGPRVYFTLKNLTDDLYGMIDETLSSIPKTAIELRDTVKKLLPKRQIIRFAIIPTIPSTPVQDAPR